MIKPMPTLLLAVLVLAGFSMASRAADETVEAWKAIEDLALRQGQATIYHNLNPTGMEMVMKDFRVDHPKIDVGIIRLGSAPLIQRFSTEFATGRDIADVVLTAVDESLFDGMKAGWMQAWMPPELKNFLPQANYQGLNMLFNIQTTRDAIVWNKSKVKPANAPKEWADLFDPKWKGKVGMNPPWRSVTQQAIIAYWEKLGLGDTASKMKANNVRFFEGSGGVLQAVIRGDVHVAQMLDLPLETALADGAPIGFIYPPSGTTASEIYVFLAAKAPHSAAGKILINWLLSEKGQVVLQKSGGLPATRPGIPALQFLPATSAIPKVQDGLALTPPAKQKEIVEHWRTVFGIQ